MSKIVFTAEMAEAGINYNKLRRNNRRVETKHKNNSRKAAAKGYRGYMMIDEKPVYESRIVEVPAKTVTVQRCKSRRYYDYVYPGSKNVRLINDFYYVDEVKEVSPAHTYKSSRWVGSEAVAKPYVKRFSRKPKKDLKRISNKRLRKTSNVSMSGAGYKKALDIAWFAM